MTFNLQQINLVYYQEVINQFADNSVAKFGDSQDMTIFMTAHILSSLIKQVI